VKVVTAEQMNLIDKTAIEDYSVPATILMNNAGKSIADFIEMTFPETAVYIFCGRETMEETALLLPITSKTEA